MKKQNVLRGIAAGIVLLSGCASFEEVKNKADAGDAEMQYKMAVMLKKGDGITADPVKSAEYMEKSFQNGYLPAVCDIADDIHRRNDVTKSGKLCKCYDIIFNTETFDVKSVIAKQMFRRSFLNRSYQYLTQLIENKKGVEAERYKKKILPYLSNIYYPNVKNIEQFRLRVEKTDTLESEQIAEKGNQSDPAIKNQHSKQEKQDASIMASQNFKSGIKLYKTIHSGLPVKRFLRLMKFPAMEFQDAVKIGEDGTKYLISTYGSGRIDFMAGFHGVIGKYSINKDYLIKQAPPGFLFGVKYNFGGNVSAKALAEKAKKDYPDVKETPERKTVNKFTWGRRNVDYDVITVTKTWESERVRIIVHYCLIEFVGNEKTLPETQRQELENEIIEGARWTNDQQRAKRMEAGMPLALNGKTMIIVDKELEQKMHEITEKAKQRDIAEKEAARKKEEQKALDF